MYTATIITNNLLRHAGEDGSLEMWVSNAQWYGTEEEALAACRQALTLRGEQPIHRKNYSAIEVPKGKYHMVYRMRA